MKRYLFAIFVLLTLYACNSDSKMTELQKREAVNYVLDSFQRAADNVNIDAYFDFFTKDATFVGTDAIEHWNMSTLASYAKKMLPEKLVRKSKPIERNIHFRKGVDNIAWFDELLDTRINLCRGTGVLIKEGGQWKIAQYVFSIVVSNELLDSVVKLKSQNDAKILDALKRNDNKY